DLVVWYFHSPISLIGSPSSSVCTAYNRHTGQQVEKNSTAAPTRSCASCTDSHFFDLSQFLGGQSMIASNCSCVRLLHFFSPRRSYSADSWRPRHSGRFRQITPSAVRW